MKITIKDKEYDVKYSIRGMFIWEQIMKKPFLLETTLDNYAYFYSLILASNPDCNLKWEEFIDAVDQNPNLTTEIMNYLISYHDSQNIFDDEETAEKITGEKKN